MRSNEVDDLGPAGRRLFESLDSPTDTYAVTALIVEAARVKDRLDVFARLLDGDEELWLRLIPSRGDVEVLEVRPDGALQESRQQAVVLRQLIAEIRRLQEDSTTGQDDHDDLADL